MVVLSGVLIALSVVLLTAGFLGGAGFVYASLVLSLLAAALLPVGATRLRSRCAVGRRICLVGRRTSVR
jgi:hypothetical protein